jgi:leader peptidase (prepilin peptidase) / N-methyltransferase
VNRLADRVEGVPAEPRAMTRLRWAAVAVAAALAVACVAVFGATLDAVVNAAGCVVLVVVTVTDLERRIVPNRVVIPALVVALVVQTARDPSIEWVLAAIGAGGFFLVAALVYPAGMGMGDVKLAAFLGAWLGSSVVVALFAGSLIACVPAVGLLLTQGSRARKIGLPFAPFLAAGAVVALFWGEPVIDWWLG